MEKKLILITNDDGIESDGLIKLAKAAVRYGDVWVVAPDRQQSGMSHSIKFPDPMNVKEVDYGIEGVRAFSCDGTPANCMNLGIHAVLPRIPDLSLSGINAGYNIGMDIQYSGTIGAAFESIIWGVPCIAFSQGEAGKSEVTDLYLDQILGKLIAEPVGKNQVWNVNFPSCKAEECGGILYDRVVSQENFYDDKYVEAGVAEDGTRTFKVAFGRKWKGTPGTDLDAVVRNYVSVGKVTNLC